MAEHSPTPWRLDGGTIRDAEDDVVVSTFSPANMETRRLIVEAVNERDRLREELDAAKTKAESEARWACEYFKTAQQAEAEAEKSKDECNRLRDLVKELADALDTFVALEDHEIDLLREAREALGKEVSE